MQTESAWLVYSCWRIGLILRVKLPTIHQSTEQMCKRSRTTSGENHQFICKKVRDDLVNDVETLRKLKNPAQVGIRATEDNLHI